MAEATIAQEGREDTRKGCAECGSTEKALMAPVPNARGYEGPMYCLHCNPRFAGGGSFADAVANLERMGA